MTESFYDVYMHDCVAQIFAVLSVESHDTQDYTGDDNSKDAKPL